MDTSKKKILVLTYDFYPDNSPNTYRWLNVLKEWRKKGVEVHVLSFHKAGFPEYQEFEGIKIYRTGKSLFEKFKNKIFSVVEQDNLIVQNQTVIKESFIRKVYNFTWKKLYFPDFAFLWQSSAFKKASEIISNENISDLITVSWPFSDHVVGAKLKDKYADLNWIADTIDPFYLSKAVNNNSIYNSLNYRYEKKILSSADAITVLTDKLKGKYAELYPSIKDRIWVNHNIFVPYERIMDNEVVDKSTIKLVFVGTLTPITRSPADLLNLFQNLLNDSKLSNNLELHFYGDWRQCSKIFEKFNHLLNESLFIHGIIPREEIPKILNKASVLINIGNNNEFQEPSKILEYIYLSKPILNVCSINADSSLEILSAYELNYSIHKNDINDPEKVNDVFKFIRKINTLKNENSIRIFQKYLLPEVENRYFELLKK